MKAQEEKQGKKLANARELAARYGVCRRTITNWVREGRLHQIKLGRRCARFDVDKADAEIARFTVEAVRAE
jgi:predicted site-specific integrase-resolvase